MKLTVEVSEDVWEGLHDDPTRPLFIPLDEIELQQGLLTETRRIAWGEKLSPHAAPGWDAPLVLRVWTKPPNPNKEDAHGEQHRVVRAG